MNALIVWNECDHYSFWYHGTGRLVRYADWQPDELDQDKEDSDSEQRQGRDQAIAKLSLMIVNENQLQFEKILHFHEWIRRFRIEATETERKKTGSWLKDLKRIIRRKASKQCRSWEGVCIWKVGIPAKFWLVKSKFESWIEIHLPNFFQSRMTWESAGVRAWRGAIAAAGWSRIRLARQSSRRTWNGGFAERTTSKSRRGSVSIRRMMKFSYKY